MYPMGGRCVGHVGEVTTCFSVTVANDQLDAQTFLIHLLQSSTCFEQYLAHPQEVKLY